MRLFGKKILIVGATSGMGRELARQLARKGCSLVLFSRRAKLLQGEFETMLPAERLLTVSGDVREQADILRLHQDATKRFGSMDGVIFCTGVSRPDFIEALDLERAIDTIRVNFEGALRVFYTFLPDLVDRAGTFLAGFTSMAGDRGMPKGHSYCSSKAALDRLLESLRIDLMNHQVSVFTITPGYVDTPMARQNDFPMPGIIPVDRGVSYLLRQMERGRLIIRFPWYHSLGMTFLRFLPNKLYWWLMNQSRPSFRIKPRPEDEFSWPEGY